jgi:hypothetical protein
VWHTWFNNINIYIRKVVVCVNIPSCFETRSSIAEQHLANEHKPSLTHEWKKKKKKKPKLKSET